MLLNRGMFRLRHPLVALLSALIVSGCGTPDTADTSTSLTETAGHPQAALAGYAGSTSCAECHQQEVSNWAGSHHQLAMLEATPDTILGDFDTRLEHNGKRTEFIRDGEKFIIRTDDTGKGQQDFEVLYTFGVEPLQMYLVKLTNGKIQAFSLAWDSRQVADGGQKWFHVYGNEQIPAEDPLHWTQTSQNWDTMCADCHSTGLNKRYDLKNDSFNTTWTEVNVSCEACHGPAAEHVKLVTSADPATQAAEKHGFAKSFDERDNITWELNAASGNSLRSAPRESSKEIDTCASCHSRRSKTIQGPATSEPFMNGHIPALIDPGLYHADGQILDEVYVYGSFMQSKMHSAGVTCSDCHEPHSLELRLPGPQVCLQCHDADKFARTEHHLHSVNSPGADCVECHMPATTYMQVDPRHDHSIRIPRPWQSEQFGTQDACLNCHSDKDSAWSTATLKRAGVSPGNHWSEELPRIMNATSMPSPDALAPLIEGAETPGIIKATVLSNGLYSLHPDALRMLEASLNNPDPLIRLGAVRGLVFADPATRKRLALDALQDASTAVRLAAVPVVTMDSIDYFSQDELKLLRSVIKEYEAAQLVNAERAESHVNLGNLYRNLGRFGQAEDAYLTSIKVSPVFVPGYINLTDLYRVQNRNEESIAILKSALQNVADQPLLNQALGFTLVRLQRTGEALPYLKAAAESPQAEARFALSYALALDATGDTNSGLEYLISAQLRFADNQEIQQGIRELQSRSTNTGQ